MKTATKIVLIGAVLAAAVGTVAVFSGRRSREGYGAPSPEIARVRELCSAFGARTPMDRLCWLLCRKVTLRGMENE